MGLEILDEIVQDIGGIGEEYSVYGFAMDLVDYVKRTWVNGKFSVQDWNIFDVGKLSTKILHRIIISKSCPKFCKFGDNFFFF